MRQRFEQQMRLSTIAISDVKFPLKSRDELPPVLKALQYIFITPQLNEKVFALLENSICKNKKKTGRKGMDLWHLFVLAVVRHTLDTNWDRLQMIANYDELVRSIMGVHGSRFESLISNPPLNTIHPEMVIGLVTQLKRYNEFVKKFTNQIERRLLQGEAIAAAEKIFSIFEEHTEWITKGKLNKKVELGHLLLITTDQHHFIVDYKIMEKQKDGSQVKDLQERLDKKYEGKVIYSHSFDKGFWSKDNYQTLQESKTEHVILPKKGKLTKEEKEREGSKTFKKLRHAHSAVESNINMLEHHGLNRCFDKGLRGFKRCVGLSIVAYNLHQLGNALLEKEREEARRKQKALSKAA